MYLNQMLKAKMNENEIFTAITIPNKAHQHLWNKKKKTYLTQNN